MPTITSFWETILLGAQSYGGVAFAAHAALDPKAKPRAGRFARWLVLWSSTVDELFAGERAEEAKRHAERVARAFHGRLEGRATADAEPSDGLPVTLHGPSR